jgi:hypothetical protein
MIRVERQSADGLSARVWEFSPSLGYLRLTFYMEGHRPTARHKFRGDSWNSTDERSYASPLKRPTSIPRDVAEEALRQVPPPKVTIGWATDEFIAPLSEPAA